MQNTYPYTKKELVDAINHFMFYNKAGVRLWAPYIRNDNFTQDDNVPRGLGKTYPAEIQRSIDYIYSNYPELDEGSIRTKLIDGSLPDPTMNYKGIDCSGFVYIIYEELYRSLHSSRFSDCLYMPKSQVLNGAFNYVEWRQKYELSNEEANDLPEFVQVSWVVDKFGRHPINLCNVATLTSDMTSVEVDLENARIGDIIEMVSTDNGMAHISIITDISVEHIEIVHSTRHDPGQAGGITTDILPITGGIIGLDNMKIAHQIISLRRLVGLNG